MERFRRNYGELNKDTETCVVWAVTKEHSDSPKARQQQLVPKRVWLSLRFQFTTIVTEAANLLLRGGFSERREKEKTTTASHKKSAALAASHCRFLYSSTEFTLNNNNNNSNNSGVLERPFSKEP